MDDHARREPFVGPAPFTRQDAWRFFGRADVAEELLSLLLSSRSLLLYATSGAGKTSIVHAGLLPLVEQEGFDILPTARVQGILPRSQGSAEDNPYTFFTLKSWQVESHPTGPGALVEALRARPRPNDAFGDPARRLIVLDQFEELFTAFPQHWQHRRGFVETLAGALDDDPLLHVLICLREDYLGEMLSFAPLLPDRLRTRLRLPRLGGDEAREAIEGPAQAASLTFADGVVDTILKDLMLVRVETGPGVTIDVPGEYVEPVQLQVVCSSLTRSLPEGTSRISADDLRQFGDVTSALARFYDGAVDETAALTGIKADVIRNWFATTLITPARTRSMAFRGIESTEGLQNPAVDALEDRHMIRAEVRSGSRWYELTHDRFIGPIDASNAAHQPRERIALWGIAPLVAGLATLFFVWASGADHGVATQIARVAWGALAAVGCGQLVDASLRARAKRAPAARTPPQRWWRLARRGVIPLGVLALGFAVAVVTQTPESSAATSFPTYAATALPLLIVHGTPVCGGSTLRVYIVHPTPNTRKVTATVNPDLKFLPSGTTDPIIPFLRPFPIEFHLTRADPTPEVLVNHAANTWCVKEATTDINVAVVLFWGGGAVAVLGVLAWRRQRRLARVGDKPAGRAADM